MLLAVPPLVLLFLWQALWSAALNRLAAPPWLTAVTGSVVGAWPLAIALPAARPAAKVALSGSGRPPIGWTELVDEGEKRDRV